MRTDTSFFARCLNYRYHCKMKEQKEEEMPQGGIPSKEKLKELLKRDFESVNALAYAIVKEDALLDYLAEYVYSKQVTAQNQEREKIIKSLNRD